MGRIAGALLCLGVLALCVFGTTNVSCYSAPTPACGFQCNDANHFQCPADYTCSMADGVCKLNSAPSGTRCPSDAPPDVPSPDADPTNPFVTGSDPGDGAINVARNAPIKVFFSMDVTPPDATDFQVTDNGVQQPGTYTYEPNTKTATFTPTGALEGGHAIVVVLTSDITSAVAHSPLTPHAFTFTTFDDEPPMLASSPPLDSATMVPINSTIVVVFSEKVTGVDTTSFTVAQGATGIAGTVSANADQMTYTFTPSAALPAASVITVTLSAAIKDVSPNANPLVPTAFSFTTQ